MGILLRLSVQKFFIGQLSSLNVWYSRVTVLGENSKVCDFLIRIQNAILHWKIIACKLERVSQTSPARCRVTMLQQPGWDVSEGSSALMSRFPQNAIVPLGLRKKARQFIRAVHVIFDVGSVDELQVLATFSLGPKTCWHVLFLIEPSLFQHYYVVYLWVRGRRELDWQIFRVHGSVMNTIAPFLESSLAWLKMLIS